MTPRRGEVWLADLGYVEKTRPVIVISRDESNPPRAITTYIPITKENRGSAYEIDLGQLGFLDRGSVANVQAVATAGTHRFLFRKGVVPPDLLKKVEQALLLRLGMTSAIQTPDENQKRQVETATESRPVKGEGVLESEDLKRQLKEAKERESKKR
jgi:mRNA interferase MazF